jgi:hypothetical protein
MGHKEIKYRTRHSIGTPRRDYATFSMSAGAKMTAKLVYQLMEDFNLFDQTVRLHAFIRASNEGIVQSSEFCQPRSALCEFALGKPKLIMIVARLVSGGHRSTWNAETLLQVLSGQKAIYRLVGF